MLSSEQFFKKNIFNPWLVDSMDVGLLDTKGQL
jgi:hypothetical protein